MSDDRLSSRLAVASIVAIAFHGVAMLTLHFVDPAVDPLAEMVGAYLVGDGALLSRATFFAMACALAALGGALLCLRRQGAATGGILFMISCGLLTVATIGFVAVTLLPEAASAISRPTQPATVLSILSLTLALRKLEPWKPVGHVLLCISILLLALFVSTILLGFVSRMGLGGLANRVVLLLIYTWVVLVARGVIRAAARLGAR